MGEYKVVDKAVVKIIRHLLASASSDTARLVLMSIHIDKEAGYACAADGFKLTFLKYENSGLESLGLESGNYIITLGRLNFKDIVGIQKVEKPEFPFLVKILHPEETKPLATFSINASLLKQLLSQTQGTVTFKVYEDFSTQTIELTHEVSAQPVYSAIMPMHQPSDTKSWKPTDKIVGQ